MPIAVTPVAAHEIDTTSASLARAFLDDPMMLYLSGTDELAEADLVPFFRAFQKIQLAHEMTFATEDRGAVAVWAPPGEWRIPFTKVVRHSTVFIKLYGTRFLGNLQVLTDLEKQHPDEPHYYLEFIGTDPAHQGKGYGTALIEPIAARADAEGVGMYLESSKESNVPFYARFGFEVTSTMQHRRNGPEQWLMWRKPR